MSLPLKPYWNPLEPVITATPSVQAVKPLSADLNAPTAWSREDSDRYWLLIPMARLAMALELETNLPWFEIQMLKSKYQGTIPKD